MKRVLIIGYGISGKATAALLARRGVPFVVVDRNGPVFDKPDFPLEGIGQVILSPGIPRSHPIVVRALAAKIEVIGEVEMALRLVENRCVGVTGSNGKTTTCSLIAHVLKAKAVGNIGAALSSYLLEANPKDILVIELSSFQLETLTAKKLELGIILNIVPNHLDRHSSMDEYGRTKIGLQKCVNGKLLVSAQVDRDWGALLGPREIFDQVTDVPKEYFKLGVQNVLAAERVCEYFGVSREQFLAAIATFKKPLHRMEFLGEKNGRLYYNDSKATSVEAVIYGVGLLEGSGVLIAGGVHKGASYRPWIETLRGKVKKMIAYGQAASIMETELSPHFSLDRVNLFEEAVVLAERAAKKGDFVLLSPGCSSDDQFKSYEHRGDAFRKWFKKESL